MRRAVPFLFFALCTVCVVGCPPQEETVTTDEAREGLEESIYATQAESLTYESIEISTDFTIGDAVEDAAQELADFIQSQIPCTTVTREGASITVDYGTLDDACVYNGHTYAGLHNIVIARNDAAEVQVDHAWTGFTNGELTLDGTANVTWSGENTLTRHVVHDFSWTRNGTSYQATGDRSQTLVDPSLGLAGGVLVNGTRTWTGGRGTWTLTLDDVEIRGQDPLPQAGAYTLTTPDDKEMGLAFSRIDDNTIEVTITGLRRERSFRVSSTGDIAES